MDISVFLLVLCSSCIHALWNFTSKKVSGDLSITTLGLWMANLTLLPFSLVIVSKYGFDTQGLRFLVITAIGYVFYFLFLNLSYKAGDISTVYPISRGTGVAGTAIIAHIFLKEIFSGFGVFGIVLIFLGVLLISIKKKLINAELKPVLYSIMLGLTVIIYSINDKQGVSYINPIVYINFRNILALLIMTPFVSRKGFPLVKEILTQKLRYSAIIGYGVIGSYLLTLFAYTRANVGYVSPVREFSVVIGTALGVVFLKEKLTIGKIIGIILVTAGLVFIKLS